MDLDKIIEKAVSEAINKVVAEKMQLDEMARLNGKDNGAVAFPRNKYNIHIWPDDHNPPHFHITTNEGWDLSFLISNGSLYRTNKLATVNDSSDYNYMVKMAPKWLKAKSFFMKGLTNQQAASNIWKKYHKDN